MAIAPHLKKNLWIVAIVGLVSAFTYRFSLPFVHQSLYQLLSLYSPDFFHGAIWTLLTYPFAIPFSHSLTVYDVYQFIFDLVIIGFLSHQILKKMKPLPFYIVFYGTAMASATTLLILGYFFEFSFGLAGLRGIFFALLMTWTELYNTNNFFFSRSVSTRTITLFTVGFTAFIDIANGAYIDLALISLSILYSYIFTKSLSVNPSSTMSKIILEDAMGNPIFKENYSGKVHSIYQGRSFHRLLGWMRWLKNLFLQNLERK